MPGWLDGPAQREIAAAVLDAVDGAGWFQPVMPRNGRPLSVLMCNLGPLGWVSDRQGYRYTPVQPLTGSSWPPIPPPVLRLWRACADYPHAPQCCLVNWYREGARMGLHRDEDEQALDAPVVSVSLGDDALFRLGGLERRDPTRSMRLRSGDVVVLGGASRLRFHGVDRTSFGTSRLLPEGGRLNLTLRRVTPANGAADS